MLEFILVVILFFVGYKIFGRGLATKNRFGSRTKKIERVQGNFYMVSGAIAMIIGLWLFIILIVGITV